ncbi:PAXNEB-domain-containing protein [Guyanagaster necrorhizus]|uniref:Elongator complex protein 4 n=1 Tax=Guyanagaster necrorhizus TaxID=856835 RepID=A0A9P8AWL6_9AGAR|nr:PAXNEB-domain-containing protein [Guyanagaster necrorhizus MCA 3950]KAG7450321.1 PAXNEB-domain-containing protein [Guyanagaster necrorhizus MCA 3950]
MSSFKKKVSSEQIALTGTRSSPGSTSTIITSTGIPSLDDLLGGGLPLSCSLLVQTSDPHSSYGELVHKYFIAQGLVTRQNVCVISENPLNLVKGCMWLPNSGNIQYNSPQPVSTMNINDDEETGQSSNEKIKIAWRYEQMKQFQTTVPSSALSGTEESCSTFDLTCRIPDSIINSALQSGQLSLFDVGIIGMDDVSAPCSALVLRQIEKVIKAGSPSTPLRICIPALGSPEWGDVNSKDILRFLHRFRTLLKQHAHTCASISLPCHVSRPFWDGPGWSQKLGWCVDGSITLSAFSANPALTALSPSHHGLVEIRSLPAPHTLLSPSDKFSTLRGLSSSATSSGGGGENNLAFKCTRKRLVFETLHLDVEGGVGERRTTPSTGTVMQGVTNDNTLDQSLLPRTAVAAVEVLLEEDLKVSVASSITSTVQMEGSVAAMVPNSSMIDTLGSVGGEVCSKGKKPKKRVAFQSDRPDLYDF